MKYITGIKLKNLIPILKQDPLDYPIIEGVLDGTFKGFALADDTDSPRKALIFHNYIGLVHYLGSEPSKKESSDLVDKILNYRSERDFYNVIEFAHCPLAVIDLIEKQNIKIKKHHRISWEHDYNLFRGAPNPADSPDLFVSFLKRDDFKDEFVRRECEMFWETYEIFLNKAMGTIARDKKGNFMGVCGAVSDSSGYYEINIETAKEHRRKGVGYAIAYKYIEECYKQGYLPHWDCYDYNEPSQALAKKLGFKEAGRYPLISWNINTL